MIYIVNYLLKKKYYISIMNSFYLKFLRLISRKKLTHLTFVINEISLIKSFHRFFLQFFTILYYFNAELFSLLYIIDFSFRENFL